MSAFSNAGPADSIMITAVLSGLGAGMIATIATVAIERLGGHLGGIIGTLPTTIIPASWGLWSQLARSKAQLDPAVSNDFALSMYAVPAGMGLNAMFLWLWRALPPRLPQHWPTQNLSLDVQPRWFIVSVMSLLTLGAWLLGALLWVWCSKIYLVTVVSRYHAAVTATGIMIVVGLRATYNQPPAPRGTQSVSLGTLFLRGLCASIAVAVAILISRHGASTLAGVAAVFPAIFWTTMVSLWMAQGPSVPTGAVGPMMLGSSSVAIYALIAPWFYLHCNVIVGTCFTWLIASLGISVPSYLWISYRARQKQP